MYLLIIVASLVLILQVALFFIIRAKKKKEKEDSVIEKYNIRSASDAFKLINDQEIPEEDRVKIEQLYKGEDA
ncbi:MAG: hypothetical protein AAFX87_20020 [Bacteroidota bacterium]